MASSNSPSPATASLSPAFVAAFRSASAGLPALRFDAFMRLALYHPELGYYRRDRLRVGRDRSADFYTASSLGPLFGQLIAAACAKLLRDSGLDPASHTFVEIGAEPSGGVLTGLPVHPFAASRVLRVGEDLSLSGPCVVFSNELFDAQPVRRFLRRNSAWHELGVTLEPGSASLAESDLGPVTDLSVVDQLPPFPATPEGYHFDAPFEAAHLARSLAAQPWHGLFVAFDYGKSFAELGHAVPAGTTRAYFQHTQSNDLLARPGEQDLTAHVCWDWLAAAFHPHSPESGNTEVVSQESFFVHHAGDFIAATLSATTSATDPQKRALLHLLHPGHMGQKFQVLHAQKAPPS